MKMVPVLASLAVVLAVAACDRDERLVQQHKNAAVENPASLQSDYPARSTA